VNWNFQLGIHPDADQLSVFVEGAATSREHERMLAHLAECAECRKAVFFMQPQEEMQAVGRQPVKGGIWGRLLPVGLPAAALACGLVAVMVHIWNRDSALRNPQQVASLRKSEVHLPPITVAPSTDSETVQRLGTARGAAPASNLSAHANLSLPKSLNMPESSGQAAAKVAAPETTAAGLSADAPVGRAGGSAGGVIGGISPELPLNGRDFARLENFAKLQQIPAPSGAQDAASQNDLAKKKDLDELMIEPASGQDKALAGVSGRITDRTGATISGARVSVRDAIGNTRQTTTSADGSFNLTGLPAGRYELTATAIGFKTTEQSIELNPSQLAMMEPVLDVGTVSETVEVASAAAPLQTESAKVGQVVAEIPGVGWDVGVPSGLPVTATVSHGKRFISLDNAGNLFLSRNGGKKWKKINAQWAGKAVRIELTPAYSSEAPAQPKNETLGKASEAVAFLLTTDSGTVWKSKDGAHWRQQ
jgi:Carboxypeptidase regulatory-like domain/Putative zinc-finger